MGAFFSKLFSKKTKSEPLFISPLLTDAAVAKSRLGEQPSLYECALMSYLAYDTAETQKKLWSEDYQARNYLAQKGWALYKEATQDEGGYCSSVLINHATKQVSILYRGTVPTEVGTLAADADLVSNKVTTQQASAEAFTRKILDELKTQTNPVIVSNELNAYQLWFVGHSLGGWLAQTSASRFQENYRAMAVAFDSPGAADMIDKTQGSGQNIVGMGFTEEQLRNLPITNILSAPNIINTCGIKIGRVYRTFVIPEKQSDIKAWFTFHFQQHSITNIINSFDITTGIPKKSLKLVHRWPKVEWDKIGNGAKMTVSGVLSTLTGNYTGLINVITGIRDMFEGDEQKRNYYSFTNDLSSEPNIADLDYKQQYRLQCVAQYEAQEIDSKTFDVRYIHSKVRQFLEDFLAYGEAIIIDGTITIPAALQTHLFAYEKVQGSQTGYRVRDDKLAATTAADFLNEVHYQIYALGENLKPLLTKLSDWRNLNHATKFQQIEQRLKNLEKSSTEYQFLATQANQIIYQLLIQYYKDKTTIQCLFVDKKFDIDGHFINLSIIDKESFSAHEQKLKTDKTAFEDLYQSDQNLDLYNLFPSNLGKEDYRVLLTARAGTGKTTTCKYMVRQWAEGKLWRNQFDFIFWVPLRNITAQKYPGHIDLLDVVLKECLVGLDSKFNFDKDLKLIEVVKNKILHHSEKILWILDGYDEVAQISMEESSTYIETFIHEVLLQQPRYLLTSRPYYLPYHKLKLKKELVILGFSDTNVYQYIDKFFPTENQQASATGNTPKKAQMRNILHSNTSLLDLVTTPIYLEILCSVIEQDNSANVTKRPTIAQLYNQLLYGQIKRHPTLALGIKANSSSAAMLYDNQKVAEPLQCLMYIAHEAYKRQVAVIEAAQIKEATDAFQQYGDDKCLAMINQMVPFGFIKGITAPGTEQLDENKKPHYFVHLTFAEYFTALEITRSLMSDDEEERVETQKYIAQHKYNPRYESIFGFIAGILIDEQNSIYANFNAKQVTGPRRIQLINQRRNAMLMNLLTCLEEETPTNNWTHISVLMRYWQEVGQKNISAPLGQRRQAFISKLKNLLAHNQVGQYFELHYHIVRFLRTNPGILDETDINHTLIQSHAPTLQTIYMLRTLYKLAQSEAQNDIRAQVETLQTSTTPSLQLAAKVTGLLILHINNPQLHQVAQKQLSEQIIAGTYPWHVMLLELKHLHIQYPDENYAEKIATILISHIKPDNTKNSDIIQKVLHIAKEFHETAALIESKVIPSLLNMANHPGNTTNLWAIIYRCFIALNPQIRHEIIKKYFANILENIEIDPKKPLLSINVFFKLMKLLPQEAQYECLKALNARFSQVAPINQWILMPQLRQPLPAPVAMEQENTTNKIAKSLGELITFVVQRQTPDLSIPLSRSRVLPFDLNLNLENVDAKIICPYQGANEKEYYFDIFLWLIASKEKNYAQLKYSNNRNKPSVSVSPALFGLLKDEKIIFHLDYILVLEGFLLIDSLAILDKIDISILRSEHDYHHYYQINLPQTLPTDELELDSVKEHARHEAESKIRQDMQMREFYHRMLLCLLNFILPVGNKILLNDPITTEELALFQHFHVKILELRSALGILDFSVLYYNARHHTDISNNNSSSVLRFDFPTIASYYQQHHHYSYREHDDIFLFQHITHYYQQHRARYNRLFNYHNSLLSGPLSFLTYIYSMDNYLMRHRDVVYAILNVIIDNDQENWMDIQAMAALISKGWGSNPRHCSREYVRAVQQLTWRVMYLSGSNYYTDKPSSHQEETRIILQINPHQNKNFIQNLQIRLIAKINFDLFAILLPWIEDNLKQLIKFICVKIDIMKPHETMLQAIANTGEAWHKEALAQILRTLYSFYQSSSHNNNNTENSFDQNTLMMNLLALARLENTLFLELSANVICQKFQQNPAEFLRAWATISYYLPDTMSSWLCHILRATNQSAVVPNVTDLETIYQALTTDTIQREFIDFTQQWQWRPTANESLQHKAILGSDMARINRNVTQQIDVALLVKHAQENKIGAQAQLIRHLVQNRAIMTLDDTQLKIEISKEITVINFPDVATATQFSQWIQDNLNLTQLYTTAANTITHAWHHKKNRAKPQSSISASSSNSSTMQMGITT